VGLRAVAGLNSPEEPIQMSSPFRPTLHQHTVPAAVTKAAFVGLFAVSAFFLATPAIASAPVQASEVRINVGVAAAKPGDSIDIPVTLSGKPDVEVRDLTVRIGVPKRVLTYKDKELGLAVELADGVLDVTTADDKVDSSQTVVVFSAKGQSCIRPGILGYLQFVIAESAQKGEVVLKLLDSEATTCADAVLELAKGDDGRLTLFAVDEEIPVVGCFIFSH
jgi:hypothetical protein